MSLRLNPRTKIKLMQRTNLKIFKRESNEGMNFKLTRIDRNNPFTIIPQKIFNDFERKSFKRHTIKFPIKIPTWYLPIYAPREVERRIKELPKHVNYAHLTGNQLLLTLLRYDELSAEELSEMFLSLSRKPESKDLNLEQNDLVKPTIDHFLRTVDGWTMDHVNKTIWAMYEMGFKDERIWKKARFLFNTKIYAFEDISSTHFAHMFIIFWDLYKADMTTEEREMLIDQLPRYLKKMNPSNIIKMFEIVVDNGIITNRQDYLYDRHFFMMLWKTPSIFGVNGFRRALALLKRLNVVTEDRPFVVDELLPTIKKLLPECTDNQELNRLIDEVEDLTNYGVDSKVAEDYSKMIFQRLTYVETKLKLLNQTEFIEIVKADLREYREKKLAEFAEKREKRMKKMLEKEQTKQAEAPAPAV
jgi:hypothetical protein